MRNIYEMKHYKLLIIIPIAMLIVSLYFVPNIQLDQSLKGGVTIQLHTNSTVDIRTLTSAIDSKIPGAQATVSAALGGASITINPNASLASASQYASGVYVAYGNYSNAAVLIASYQSVLKAQPGNATAASIMGGLEANQTRYLGQMSTSLSKELSYLSVFLVSSPTYNTSDAQGMYTVAQNAYANASTIYKNSVITDLQGIISFSSYSYNNVTPTLGGFFLSQMETIIIAAFVLVAISVFIVFRSPVPAFAVVFSSANDILVALGVMGIVGIPFGVASIGGILMLIGYSIDTALLSSIRILKRTEDTPVVRAFGAMKTGVTMTAAAIMTFAILLVVSYVTFIPTYFEISGVVLAGLVADIFTTWLGNTPMVLAYKMRKEMVT